MSLVLVLASGSVGLGLASREAMVSAACKATQYQTACQSDLLSSTHEAIPQTEADLYRHLVQFSLNQAQSARAHVQDMLFLQAEKSTSQTRRGSNDCKELLDDTLDQLTQVAHGRQSKTGIRTTDDIQTWLSAALTNQATCLESIQTDGDVESNLLRSMAKNLSYSISNSLALYVSTRPSSSPPPQHRKLLSERFPEWVTAADRKLLEASVEELGAAAVVAKDGSGTHTTIGEALAMVGLTSKSEGRTVIHVKAGTYDGEVKIPTHSKNILLVGDGKDQTIIVGHKNYEDGSTTFNSATLGKLTPFFKKKII